MSTNPPPSRNDQHVEVLTLSDPTKVRDDIEVLDQDVITLSNKPFSAKRVLVSLESVMLIFQNSSHRLRTHTKLHPNLVAFVSIGQRSRGTIDGILLRPDMLISSAPGVEVDFVVEAGYRSITLLISPDHLQKLLPRSEHKARYIVPKKLMGQVFAHFSSWGCKSLGLLSESLTCLNIVSLLEYLLK